MSQAFHNTVFSIDPSLLNVLFTFLTYIRFFVFFNLNLCFLANSELITNPIALLSNSVSSVTPSCVSTLSGPIFTMTSLSRSPLFRLQQDILSTILLSAANLLLSRPNQELLDLPPHSNCFVCYYEYLHISSFFPGLYFIFYNSVLDGQILHSYNNSFLYLFP